jgi:hypothetical protein
MSFFNLLGKAAEGYAGTKMVQKGSDFLINKHTPVNVFLLNAGLRRHADELLKQYFLNHNGGGELNEHEAALLKLAVFYATAEQASDEHMMALVGDAIAKIRGLGGEQISADISLEVLSQTGL